MWLPSFSLPPLPYVLVTQFKVIHFYNSLVPLLILDALQFLACWDQTYSSFRDCASIISLMKALLTTTQSCLPFHLPYIPSHTYIHKIFIFHFS